MDNSGNYMIYDATDVLCNEESDDETNSDASDLLEMYSADATEECRFLQIENANQRRNMRRRIFNYIGPPRLLSHKSTRQNKSIKRFLFFFGFTSTLIILSQIYLSVSYDEYSLEGSFQYLLSFR